VQVESARESGVPPDVYQAVEDKEEERRSQRMHSAAAFAAKKVLDDANLDAVESLWPLMFAQDAEYAKISTIPKLGDNTADYKKQLEHAGVDLQRAGLEQSAKIEVRACTESRVVECGQVGTTQSGLTMA